MARTFLVLRLNNGWIVRLYRDLALKEHLPNTIPLDDLIVAKDLAEVTTVLERLTAMHEYPPDLLAQ